DISSLEWRVGRRAVNRNALGYVKFSGGSGARPWYLPRYHEKSRHTISRAPALFIDQTSISSDESDLNWPHRLAVVVAVAVVAAVTIIAAVGRLLVIVAAAVGGLLIVVVTIVWLLVIALLLLL